MFFGPEPTGFNFKRVGAGLDLCEAEYPLCVGDRCGYLLAAGEKRDVSRGYKRANRIGDGPGDGGWVCLGAARFPRK